MRKYKVKYSRMSAPGYVFFGLWDDSIDWIKWKKKEQDKTGDSIELLKTYFEETERKSNPVIAKIYYKPGNSYDVPEYNFGDKIDAEQ